MSKAKAKGSSIDSVKKDNVVDFLSFISRKAKSNNIDQFFRNGQIADVKDLFECGKYFLTHAMGCGENDFIPNLKFKEFSCYVPVSENYYPWAFFALPTSVTDLDHFFDKHGREYLLSADSGKKDYAVVSNFKKVCVYDFNHHQEKYECIFSDLYDAFSGVDGHSLENWNNLLSDFGPNKAEEKKKSRRKEMVEYTKPKESSPELQYVKRFGHMPSFEIPVGYDGRNFRDTFKTKELPFLTTEAVDWEGQTKVQSNRIIWGDNLSVMRSLPDECLDLVYIDPPFFSGRNYNCIFGDDDEIRSFKDIWDGGLPTYLAWLNARLWEIKRLLKPTGSLFVHLDWHAAHYVKSELDKIFGYDNFLNELIWCYGSGGASKSHFSRKHDNILWYSKTDRYTFNCDDVREPYKEKAKVEYKIVNGKKYKRKNDLGRVPFDWFEMPIITNTAKERIGYPTQKPETLLAKIITAASNPGDVVADFFSGGGTTVTVAEKLGRKWIGCDISRIAVSVARDRILETYDKTVGVQAVQSKPKFGFELQYHGVYERDIVRELEEKSYIDFILKCYQATPKRKGEYIHGFRDDKAIFVAPSKKNLRKDQVEEFHSDLIESKIQNGVILAWNISKELEKYVDDLRQGANGPDIQLVQVRLVDIDSNEFKGDNIRFINKPAAVIRKTQKSDRTWVFDASASHGTNGSEIHYYQWDFNFKNRFAPSTKPNFGKDNDGDGNSLNDHRRIEFTFATDGDYKVAVRVFDKSGAEATQIINVSVASKSKKVS